MIDGVAHFLIEGLDLQRFEDLPTLVSTLEPADVESTDYLVVDDRGTKYSLELHGAGGRKSIRAVESGKDEGGELLRKALVQAFAATHPGLRTVAMTDAELQALIVPE